MKIDKESYTKALNVVASSEEGRIVLAWMARGCGWFETYLSDSDPTVTQYHATRRGVYNSLRKHIEPEHLKLIEHDYQTYMRSNANGSTSSGGAGNASS